MSRVLYMTTGRRSYVVGSLCTALQNNKVSEVKHTGGGTMASFASSTNAVEPGIEMIKSIKFRNSNKLGMPLHLRVGINAGQPAAEGGDLFRTIVQVVARLWDEAKTDGVCVLQVVRDHCAGEDLSFVNGRSDTEGRQRICGPL